MSLAYQIKEMFSKLSAESQEELLQELQKVHNVKKSMPEKSYLEKKWEEIEELMETLNLEPYIDDQYEIEEIWNISEELIKSGRLQAESKAVRQKIIQMIAANDYYDCYGVYDPMENLMKAMLFDRAEVIECAEYMSQVNGYMKQNAAELLKEYGIMDRYYSFLESLPVLDAEHYMDLICHYRNEDIEKAVYYGELAVKKCKDMGSVEIYRELIELYFETGRKAAIEKLLKQAKVKKLLGEEDVIRLKQAIEN